MQHSSGTTTQPLTASAGSLNAIRWNGWLIFIIAVTCIAAFVLIQLMLTVFIILRDNPDILRYGYLSPVMQKKFTDPNFIVGFLNAKNLWLLSVLSEAILALGTLGLVRLMLDATPRALGFRGRPRRQQLVLGFGVGLLLFLASTIVGAIMTQIFGSHPQPQALALIKHHGWFDFVLDLMSVALAAPVAEEIFFRGFIFGGLAQRMSPLYAMLLSAGLFGVAHLEKWSFLPIFVIGVGLAWLYYRTQNLWVNIVAHGTVNTISLILAFTAPQLVKS